MTILVDTGPLVALCDPRDAKHAVARRELTRLGALQLRTCDAVIAEACFHLPHRSQRQRLRAVLAEFDVGPAVSEGSHDLWMDVLEWMLRHADHEPDWADGCLAVMSGRDRKTRVWTYDREFQTVWRRPDGTAIPLAPR